MARAVNCSWNFDVLFQQKSHLFQSDNPGVSFARILPQLMVIVHNVSLQAVALQALDHFDAMLTSLTTDVRSRT